MLQVVVLEVEEGEETTGPGVGLPWGSTTVQPTVTLLSSPTNRIVPSAQRRILHIAAGTNHCALVSSTGELLTWGGGKEGQLGLGPDILATPIPMRVDVGGRHVVDVSCGYVHTAVLFQQPKKTKPLFGCLTFGAGLCGALGTGNDATSSHTPQQVSIPGNTSTLRNLLYDPSDDNVDDNGDDLFRATSFTGDDSDKMNQNLHDIDIDISFTSISCGFAHMAAIVSVSSATAAAAAKSLLFTWGWNKRGQLGVGGTENEFVPVLVRGLRRYQIVSVGCGFEVTAGVTESGDLFVMGQGLEGQLGLGEQRVQCSEPQRHETLRHCCHTVACGADHTAILCYDGSVHVWGRLAGDRPKKVLRAPSEKVAHSEVDDVNILGGENILDVNASDANASDANASDVISVSKMDHKRWELMCGEHTVHLKDREGCVYEWPSKNNNSSSCSCSSTRNTVVCTNNNTGSNNSNQVDHTENTIPMRMTPRILKDGKILACNAYAAGDSWCAYVPSTPCFGRSSLRVEKNSMIAGEVIHMEMDVKDEMGRDVTHHHHGHRALLHVALKYTAAAAAAVYENESTMSKGMNVASWDVEEEDEKNTFYSSSSLLRGMVALTRAGIWELSVMHVDAESGQKKHVLGSPIHLTVEHEELCPRKCIWRPMDITAVAAAAAETLVSPTEEKNIVVVAGVERQFQLISRDMYGNRVYSGGASIRLEIEKKTSTKEVEQDSVGGKEAEANALLSKTAKQSIVDHGDGTYTCSLTLQNTGQYIVSALQNTMAITAHLSRGNINTSSTSDTSSVTSSVTSHQTGSLTTKSATGTKYKRLTIRERSARNALRKKERQRMLKFRQKHHFVLSPDMRQRCSSHQKSLNSRYHKQQQRHRRHFSDVEEDYEEGELFGVSLQMCIVPSTGAATHTTTKSITATGLHRERIITSEQQTDNRKKKTIIMTIGMDSTVTLAVHDQFNNPTIVDETSHLNVQVCPVSSHLPKDVNVPVSITRLDTSMNLENNNSTNNSSSSNCSDSSSGKEDSIGNSSNLTTNLYNVQYTPLLRGAYHVIILLHGDPIVGSPLYVRVTENNASSLSVQRRKSRNHFGYKRSGVETTTRREQRRPQTAMARTRRLRKSNSICNKNSVEDQHEDYDISNPASPTSKAPSPMIPPSTAKTEVKRKFPKTTTITASSMVAVKSKKKKRKSFKRTQSSSKMSAHMLALCQARNIKPIVTKKRQPSAGRTRRKTKNAVKSSRSSRSSRTSSSNSRSSGSSAGSTTLMATSRRPGTSMGIRRRNALPENITANVLIAVVLSSDDNDDECSVMTSAKENNTRPPLLALTSKVNNNTATALVMATTAAKEKRQTVGPPPTTEYRKRRPASSPPRKRGGRANMVSGYVPLRRSTTTSSSTAGYNVRAVVERPNSLLGTTFGKTRQRKATQHYKNNVAIQVFGIMGDSMHT